MSYPLGFVEVPDGYIIEQLDSGHWIWTHSETDAQSCIHWDKWAVYRGCKAHSEKAIVDSGVLE